jgi:hypothetical protein
VRLGPLSVDVSDADRTSDRIKSRTKNFHTVGQSGGSSDEPELDAGHFLPTRCDPTRRNLQNLDPTK